MANFRCGVPRGTPEGVFETCRAVAVLRPQSGPFHVKEVRRPSSHRKGWPRVPRGTSTRSRRELRGAILPTNFWAPPFHVERAARLPNGDMRWRCRCPNPGHVVFDVERGHAHEETFGPAQLVVMRSAERGPCRVPRGTGRHLEEAVIDQWLAHELQDAAFHVEQARTSWSRWLGARSDDRHGFHVEPGRAPRRVLHRERAGLELMDGAFQVERVMKASSRRVPRWFRTDDRCWCLFHVERELLSRCGG